MDTDTMAKDSCLRRSAYQRQGVHKHVGTGQRASNVISFRSVNGEGVPPSIEFLRAAVDRIAGPGDESSGPGGWRFSRRSDQPV